MNQPKLALKSMPDQQTVIRLSPTVEVGGRKLLIIGGPCSVENRPQMEETARVLAGAPVQVLRGGVFKPRTSPYSFQGLGEEGLGIISSVGKQQELLVVTEVMSCNQVPLVIEHADILQIGSRNMHNFELLKTVGVVNKPILLKRGLAATLEELLLAAEYIMSHGNPNIILCERGIRSFDPSTRNVLDLGAVVALKQMTHLPVIVDPSHASGKRELVAPLSRAAIACGADGIMVECHPVPEQSISDARQAISLTDMVDLVQSLVPIAEAVGRTVVQALAPFCTPKCKDESIPHPSACAVVSR